MKVDWLKDFMEDGFNRGDYCYDLAKLKSKYHVVDFENEGGGIVWNYPPHESIFGSHKFAVFRFYMSDSNSENIKVDIFWNGEGVRYALRELRHSWFGDDGHIFHLKGDLMIEAINYLKQFYDFDKK